MTVLFPRLGDPSIATEPAIRFGDRVLDHGGLDRTSAAVAATLAGVDRVAVLGTADLETCVAVIGALRAGTCVVPVNPKAGELELDHVLSDSAPDALLAPAAAEAPGALATLARIDLPPTGTGEEAAPAAEGGAGAGAGGPEPTDAEATAIILYTSGTTGLPKGVMIPRRAIASNLDALADAWEWTAADRLAHALPLFHVHGLVIGIVGPVRLGGQVEHLGRFSPLAVADALDAGATMLFGVPTMYHRLGEEAETDPSIARALAGARLLVSGSAALPAVEHERLERLTGQRIVERYGMTETLMNCAIRADGERTPAYVGRPLPGVELRLVDDDGAVIETADDATIGEIHVRGPNLFTGYLNRPDATAEAMRDGWFVTGDLATQAPNGYVRIVGRRSTDLIKSAGYRIGAGEIEGALLEHPMVAECAVTGAPDPDLGERVVAWIVLRPGAPPTREELVDHVGRLLSGHKRPRDVYFLDALPRNPMGKVVKRDLVPPA